MSRSFKVTKALIPVAGLGTRFLPATKALPKEMLPLVDKPVIQYVVEEAVDTGLTDILMITGRNKSALENHFDRVAELEQTLMAKGDEDRLEQVQESTELADIYYTRQGDPKGLGHAVLTGKQHIGDHSFAVLLGDDVIDAKDPLLSRMIQIPIYQTSPRARRSASTTSMPFLSMTRRPAFETRRRTKRFSLSTQKRR